MPATIEVTIPVRLVPEPLNEVAVTTPEILAPEEVTMPLKFPDVAVKIPTEIPLVVLFPLPVTEFKVSVSVYEVRYVFVSILPSALRNCDEVPPDLTKDVAVTIPTVILLIAPGRKVNGPADCTNLLSKGLSLGMTVENWPDEGVEKV